MLSLIVFFKILLHVCYNPNVFNLYYKERRQLKTFLTQFGPILPLTSDPPVKLHDDQKGGTTIKITIWEAFLPKTNYFCHPTLFYPPHVPVGPALLPDFLRSLPARLAPRLHTNSPPHWGARPWGGAGERAVRASARGGARPRGDCWGSWSSEASPSPAHAGNPRPAYGFGLAGKPFAARALTKH
jgi:hypothetical protein